ncbi:MAG TPA: hypothetical protein VGS61_08130, partial [Acidimicrobiales bacterium]|nr:hypothetical protein [Acidimicrobiales bacterium]
MVALAEVRTSVARRAAPRGGLGGDAVLYGLSAAFALVLGWTSKEPAQWHWGYLAVGTYAGGALVAAVARARVRRDTAVRAGLLAL